MSKATVSSNRSDLLKATRSDGIEIFIDLPACISAGPCAAVAQKTFGLREADGKAIIIDPDGDSFQDVLDAAKSCPVKAIMLKRKTGKQIFP